MVGAGRLLRGLLVLAGLMAMPAILTPAAAEEPGLMSEFYSYLPATPEINLPDLRIPFWTDDLKAAKKAYRNGKFGRALKLFRRESEAGNYIADWYLGHMFRTGRGVPRDDAMAFSYYSRVAEIGRAHV